MSPNDLPRNKLYHEPNAPEPRSHGAEFRQPHPPHGGAGGGVMPTGTVGSTPDALPESLKPQESPEL